MTDTALLMASGGDARIVLDPATGLNRYFSAPRPSGALAYASSTANDISAGAYAHVEALRDEIGPQLSGGQYRARLDALRDRIRRAYAIPPQVGIVFAPSGTDLEYAALACVAGKAEAGTHNILLGADEVGSGCPQSAAGRYFGERTALGVATAAGDAVPGLGGANVEAIDIPLRDPIGRARKSFEIAARVREAIAAARAARRHPMVHVVHGSKTGLVLPSLDDLDGLLEEYGDGVSVAVDACQARIATAAIAAYLERGAIVFLTGSKFIGGPPFSGFALVPPGFAARTRPLPEGFATLFRRAEWPEGWPGADRLPDTANPGLLLRLEAAIFELERFRALPAETVSRIVLAFEDAVEAEIVERLGVGLVALGPEQESDGRPVEPRTLVTLDLSALNGGAAFEDAQAWHKALVGRNIRLGQPVKCVRLTDGRWGATLRIALSMPMIAERASLTDDALARSFASDMAKVREAMTEIACQKRQPTSS